MHYALRQATSQPGGQKPLNGRLPQCTPKERKVQRVLYLHRVVRVCANRTDAYAALRMDANIELIAIAGNDVGTDLANVRPWTIPVMKTAQSERWMRVAVDDGDDGERDVLEQTAPLLFKLDDDDDCGDEDIRGDIVNAFALCRLIQWLGARRQADIPESYYRAHGADAVLSIGPVAIPVHRTFIAARCAALAEVFSGRSFKRCAEAGCAAITITARTDESSGHLSLRVRGLTLLTALVLNCRHPTTPWLYGIAALRLQL